MSTLYEIGADMQAFEDFLDSIDGDVSDPRLEKMLDDWLAENEKQLVDKLDGYGKLIQNRKSWMDSRRAEAKRLESLATTDENFIKALKTRLRDFFNARKITRVESSLFKFWVQNNGQRSMDINERYDGDGAKKLPERYQKVMVMADNAKIRADLEEMEILMTKKEIWFEARQDSSIDVKGKKIAEFTAEDEVRLAELVDLLDDVAWFNPVGNHLRMR